MPELPEVETVRKSLEKLYLNKTVDHCEIYLPRMIENEVSDFISLVRGQTFVSFRRKGKYLILDLSNHYSVISHLRMEGRYIQRQKEEPFTKYTRVVFFLTNGRRMCYDDTRSFGTMKIVPSDEVFSYPGIAKLGPEPFDIEKGRYLYDIYRHKSKEIKACLLDQEIMCGLGNIYCDEVLFKAKINPYRNASTLRVRECDDLLKYSKETLEHAIELGGSTISTYHPEKGVDGRFQNELSAYGREGLPCVCCGRKMMKDKINGRGTTYCPSCQKVGISIGITGKIAAGKSTVLAILKKKGYPVFSSDEEVTRLYKTVEVKKKLVEMFGEQVINDNLTISKGYIKDTIARNPSKKKELEDYIHPLVKDAILRFIQKNKQKEFIIVEVPLMFENRFYTLFDYVVGITCSYATQISHLKARKTKSLNTDLVLGQSNQFDRNVGKCHFLITNDDSLDNLNYQIDQMLGTIANQ